MMRQMYVQHQRVVKESPTKSVKGMNLERRSYIESEIKRVIESGDLEEIQIVRKGMKSEYKESYNKNLVMECFYQNMFRKLDEALAQLLQS